jgi:hypothetical protein
MSAPRRPPTASRTSPALDSATAWPSVVVPPSGVTASSLGSSRVVPCSVVWLATRRAVEVVSPLVSRRWTTITSRTSASVVVSSVVSRPGMAGSRSVAHR